jgi:hypothetical protein
LPLQPKLLTLLQRKQPQPLQPQLKLLQLLQPQPQLLL